MSILAELQKEVDTYVNNHGVNPIRIYMSILEWQQVAPDLDYLPFFYGIPIQVTP